MFSVIIRDVILVCQVLPKGPSMPYVPDNCDSFAVNEYGGFVEEGGRGGGGGGRGGGGGGRGGGRDRDRDDGPRGGRSVGRLNIVIIFIHREVAGQLVV